MTAKASKIHSIDVRAAVIDDLPELMRLGPWVFANFITQVGHFDMNAWVAEVWRFLNGADRGIFVALDGQTLVGLLLIMQQPGYLGGFSLARTLAIGLVETHRGCGAGARMQALAEEWARTKQCAMMVAAVPTAFPEHPDMSHDATVVFYESRGYAKAETVLYKEVA